MKIPKSFDQVGTIAIFNEFPRKNRQKLAKSILDQRIRTVALKTKAYSGKLRLPKIKIIAGDKTKETIHKENNVLLKLHVEKCYFSVRSSNERLRIAKLVDDGEEVLVMFSGIAPFPLVIEKNSNPKEIHAIELNKKCHKYAKDNLKLNKSKKIILHQGNVKKIVPKLDRMFDRILMPLPKESEAYLDLAIKYLRPKGTIHFYTFGKENEIKKIQERIKSHSDKIKVNHVVKAGHYSPYTYRLCFDLAKT